MTGKCFISALLMSVNAIRALVDEFVSSSWLRYGRPSTGDRNRVQQTRSETAHLEPACANVSIEQLRPHRRENRRANSISATLKGIAIRFRQPSEPVVELGSATLGCLATTVADWDGDVTEGRLWQTGFGNRRRAGGCRTQIGVRQQALLGNRAVAGAVRDVTGGRLLRLQLGRERQSLGILRPRRSSAKAPPS